jgi:hypothetical protein
MKIAIGLALALALALSSAPAIAGDSFHALSSLPAPDQANLTPLPDDQLASIEGGLTIVDVCRVCIQRNRTRQTNVAIGSAFFNQTNLNATSQEIN